MSVESVFNRFDSLGRSLGKAALNALFPNDIEVYIFALELVNGNKKTEDYFVFPINPSSVSEKNNPIQSINKTAGGISVMSTTTFSPTDISIQGNFGRKFKFLVGADALSFSSLRFGANVKEFDSKIKTGYGCCKVLENIINKSNTIDESTGKPYALYFYNLAFNNSYLVKALNFDFYQNEESNMIWNYNLTLKSLLPVEDLIDESNKSSLVASIAAGAAIQNITNGVASNTSRLMNNVNLDSIFGDSSTIKVRF